MQPVTLETPKPMVEVRGVRMIDTVIQGLHHNGITEIYVVTGYLKEQFRILGDRNNPGVKLIENPYYDSCNNISSLYMAREYIENAYHFGWPSRMIYNRIFLRPDFERSGYNCIWTDEGRQMNGF